VRGKNVQLDSQANGADVAGGSRPNIQTYNYTQTLKEFAKSMGLPSGSVMTTGKVVRVNVGGRLHFKLPDLITD
jgi:hypothetical protein